jgi:ubiquitin-conjugating enzyme E2 N
MSDSPPGISAAPKDDNLRHFDVSVSGPGQSPYEGELK